MKIDLTEAQARVVHFWLGSQLPTMSEGDRAKALKVMAEILTKLAKYGEEPVEGR